MIRAADHGFEAQSVSLRRIDERLHNGGVTFCRGVRIQNFSSNVYRSPSADAADGLVDDLEDGNNRVAQLAGRGGYWWSAKDDKGSTIEPSGEAPA